MRVKLLAALAVGLGVAALPVAGVVLSAGGEAAPTPAGSTADTAPAPASGPRAPALAGTDPVTGKRVRLADYRGKPVVLNVWASWCEPCAEEAPALAQFAKENPRAVLIGLDLQDTFGGAKGFYERFGWKHRSIFDPDGALAARVELLDLPTTIFLTPSHRESSRILGPATFETLTKAYEKARDS
jgi:thiol-disulfide isomerase/thioredoxin